MVPLRGAQAARLLVATFSHLMLKGGDAYKAFCMLQGESAQEVKAPAEGIPGPPAETPLAPYVPLMATDAVADAAAALLLDDVVPVQEENVVVVESISSNAGQGSERLCPLCLA